MNGQIFRYLKLPARQCLGLLALLAVSTPGEAADWLIINPLRIDLLAGYYALDRDSPTNQIERYWWEGGVRIAQEVSILDPRILRISYSLEPRYRSGEYSDKSITEDTSDDLLGYFLGIDILRGAVLPVDGRLVASNSSTVNTGSLGRRSEYEIKLLSAEMNWKYQPFPMVFRVRERSTFSIQQTTVGGSTFLRDDDERIFSIVGQSSKMRLEYERRMLDDKVPTRNNDFEIDKFTGRHWLDWGRASNLTTRFQYWNRTGFNAFERSIWTQNARIYHTPSLDSKAGYTLQHVTQTTKTKIYSANYKLHHRLYNNLTTGVGARYRRRNTPDLLETAEQLELDVSYRKSDIFGLSASLTVGGAFARVDRDSDKGFFEVVDQPYTVPISGQIILSDRFIVRPTIIVTSADSTQIYDEGVDYETLILSNGITQLSVLPGGRIEVGQVLLISYTAAILPSVKYDRISRRGNLALSYRGFSLTYRNDALRNDVISGAAASLIDTEHRTAKLSYSKDFSRLTMVLTAERRFVMVGDNETTTKAAYQSLTFRASPRTVIGLSLTQSFSTIKTSSLAEIRSEDVDLYVGSLNVSWKPFAGLVINPALHAWKREQVRERGTVASVDDTILSASLNVEWRFRKLLMTFRYHHNDRTFQESMQPAQDTIEDVVQFNLRRRF
jgi:hypothetical protein